MNLILFIVALSAVSVLFIYTNSKLEKNQKQISDAIEKLDHKTELLNNRLEALHGMVDSDIVSSTLDDIAYNIERSVQDTIYSSLDNALYDMQKIIQDTFVEAERNTLEVLENEINKVHEQVQKILMLLSREKIDLPKKEKVNRDGKND